MVGVSWASDNVTKLLRGMLPEYHALMTKPKNAARILESKALFARATAAVNNIGEASPWGEIRLTKGKDQRSVAREDVIHDKISNWFNNHASGKGSDGKKDLLPLFKKTKPPGLAVEYFNANAATLRPQLDAAFATFNEMRVANGEAKMRAAGFASSWKAKEVWAKLSEEEQIAFIESRAQPDSSEPLSEAEQEEKRILEAHAHQEKVEMMKRSMQAAVEGLFAMTGTVSLVFTATMTPTMSGQPVVDVFHHGSTLDGKSYEQFNPQFGAVLRQDFARFASKCFSVEDRKRLSLAPQYVAVVPPSELPTPSQMMDALAMLVDPPAMASVPGRELGHAPDAMSTYNDITHHPQQAPLENGENFDAWRLYTSPEPLLLELPNDSASTYGRYVGEVDNPPLPSTQELMDMITNSDSTWAELQTSSAVSAPTSSYGQDYLALTCRPVPDPLPLFSSPVTDASMATGTTPAALASEPREASVALPNPATFGAQALRQSLPTTSRIPLAPIALQSNLPITISPSPALVQVASQTAGKSQAIESAVPLPRLKPIPRGGPRWLSTCRTYLRKVWPENKVREENVEMMNLWIEYETFFPSRGEPKSLSFHEAPLGIQTFLDSGMDYTITPVKLTAPTGNANTTDSQAHECFKAWLAWWRCLQPPSRAVVNPTPFQLPNRDRPHLFDDWRLVCRGGPKGMSLVILFLSWWFKTLDMDAPEDCDRYTEAVEETTWVLKGLVDGGRKSKISWAHELAPAETVPIVAKRSAASIAEAENAPIRSKRAKA